MTTQPTRPEDILPDGVDTTEMHGRVLRKGSVAAVIANANVLASEETTDEQKQEALEIIKELAPTLAALGLHEHVVWKNDVIEKIMEDAVDSLQGKR